MSTATQSHNSNMLDGLLVVDFSQFLAGPLAGLKLADLGARVIKIERPEVGDLCRYLYLSEVEVADANALFHAINRNKESFAANLKNSADLKKVQKLVAQADVVIQNFRPGVISKFGLDYDCVRNINPRVIYASISGYGEEGDWKDLPGQDLLAQARSGVMWLTGDADDPPTAIGLAVADQLAGNFAVQGILAAVVRREQRGIGAHVQTSLLEALLDFQFEVLTTHLNDRQKRLPQRSSFNNAHAYLSAPYGVYQTADGYLAIAMTAVDKLGTLIGSNELAILQDAKQWFEQRDKIKKILAELLKQHSTAHWMSLFVAADIWAAEILEWPELFQSRSFVSLDFVQELNLGGGKAMKATRLPIRIDGKTLKNAQPAPSIGEQNAQIEREFSL